MFCSQCGQSVADDARFCPNCGQAVDASDVSASPGPAVVDRGDRDKVLLSYRPVFVPKVTFLTVLPFGLFFGLWCGGFLGIPGAMLGVIAFDNPALGISLAVVGGLIGLFGMPMLFYVAKQRTYARTEYRFYRDRLEYAEGFWTAEQKTIPLDRISEVSLRIGVIQKQYNLGTIYLATPATGAGEGQSRSGIRLTDIPEPEQVYKDIKALLGL